MNERVEMAQDWTLERSENEPGSSSRASPEARFRKDSECRAGCDLPNCVSLQNMSRAQAPSLPERTRDQAIISAKNRKIHFLFYTRTHSHMRGVEGLLQPRQKR